MPHPYDDLDAETRAALLLSRDELLGRLGDRAEVFPSNQDMVRAFADRILSDFRECRAAGRDRVAMIVPVGPVGQYGYLAERCLAEDLSLDRLTLIVMDEYLTDVFTEEAVGFIDAG